MPEQHSSHEAVLERYLEFWNSRSDEDRRGQAARVFTENVEYVAPIGVLSGPEALIDFGRQFLDHMTTASFRAVGAPEFHHDRARLRWAIAVGDNAEFATGTDVIAFDDAERIASVTTFLDKPPEGFDQHAHE